ncbi:MAG: HIT domain-containing protein [Armatimonadetes bacterium]|nr:HIT domain-containing protein [Armatimonadota bacterium]
MERLWAPWRMEYVSAEAQSGCIFCRARDDCEWPGVIFRGRCALVMLNAYPYNSGHLLVVPHAHVPNITDLGDDDLGYLAVLTKASVKALERALRPAGFNVGMNIGAPAGAGIAEHVHMHIVPRWVGDTNFMTVLAETRVVPEALQACEARLKPVFAELAKELGLEAAKQEGS